jgi:hypothetical protein
MEEDDDDGDDSHRFHSRKSKRIPSIFNDESTESFISLRRHI